MQSKIAKQWTNTKTKKTKENKKRKEESETKNKKKKITMDTKKGCQKVFVAVNDLVTIESVFDANKRISLCCFWNIRRIYINIHFIVFDGITNRIFTFFFLFFSQRKKKLVAVLFAATKVDSFKHLIHWHGTFKVDCIVFHFQWLRFKWKKSEKKRNCKKFSIDAEWFSPKSVDFVCYGVVYVRAHNLYGNSWQQCRRRRIANVNVNDCRCDINRNIETVIVKHQQCTIFYYYSMFENFIFICANTYIMNIVVVV